MDAAETVDKETEAGFFKNLVQLWQTFFATLGEVFHLAVLELRLAKRSLVLILGFLVVIGFLAIASGLSLMAILAVWLVSQGLSWMLSLLCILGLNVLLIIVIFLFILRLTQNLKFKATRRHLGFAEKKHETKSTN